MISEILMVFCSKNIQSVVIQDLDLIDIMYVETLK